MKLILIKDVENVGNKGEVVTVKPGFGRNFLIPQKLAITFSNQQLKHIEEQRSQEGRKIERQKDVLLDCKAGNLLMFKGDTLHGNTLQPKGEKIAISFNLGL